MAAGEKITLTILNVVHVFYLSLTLIKSFVYHKLSRIKIVTNVETNKKIIEFFILVVYFPERFHW